VTTSFKLRTFYMSGAVQVLPWCH